MVSLQVRGREREMGETKGESRSEIFQGVTVQWMIWDLKFEFEAGTLICFIGRFKLGL